MQIRMSRAVVRAVILIPVVAVLTAAASAQVSAPRRPDEPAIYISSSFVQDDGPIKVVKDVTIRVAGVSIASAAGRMHDNGQITLQNATVTISEDVATHVRNWMIYQGDIIRDLSPGR